jgi:hypothetical protein
MDFWAAMDSRVRGNDAVELLQAIQAPLRNIRAIEKLLFARNGGGLASAQAGLVFPAES